MIDNAVILFTTAMCMLVVLRAIRLDSRLPWFGEGWRPRARMAQGQPAAALPPPPRWGGEGAESQRDVP